MVVVLAMMLSYNPRIGMVYFVATPYSPYTRKRVYNNEADDNLPEIQGANLNSTALRLKPFGITFWILPPRRWRENWDSTPWEQA
ncbi:hypothetical protein B0O80DRAFT_464712 [Mortierella sp. GBAus27b]|nr:hypothetical protein B0O80DRAFT_464712 [Mortierella sp. GBAus27b]